jgi:hypothetical protein
MKLTGENRSTRRKTCLSATLSTTNPTWTDQGSNLGLRGDRPATNRLSHGTANCNIMAYINNQNGRVSNLILFDDVTQSALVLMTQKYSFGAVWNEGGTL